MRLLESLLRENEPVITPSKIVIPTISTPDLFQWHRMLLKMNERLISTELKQLINSCSPSNKPFRPWISISLPMLSGTTMLMDLNIEDLTQQPKSDILDEEIAKPIRMFLLSLNEAQCKALPVSLFTDDSIVSPMYVYYYIIIVISHFYIHIYIYVHIYIYIPTQCSSELNAQQMMLIHESRARIRHRGLTAVQLTSIFDQIVEKYQNNYCYRLQESLSTKNILTALNFLQTMEQTLKDLKVRAQEAHENLQVREILGLAKPSLHLLRDQLQRLVSIFRLGKRPICHWINLQMVCISLFFFHTYVFILSISIVIIIIIVIVIAVCSISKFRSALIRHLNSTGIGKVDFKHKFGGAIINFTDKRVSNILVNAIIREIYDVFSFFF
ncbi:hypothetical protein RFI_10816 [Reticulomyxa filosa]|uniref:Uncharacterized protein n=1 Tax=Reticulomyxa filosa TaxID=46433 RepID=X6NK21_RETFI|nr:hypothetical protein RFI_10816 [Reticulomyxa filosa]|eukprot:ETO26321.1 hypothetical protein RFI_10816 [Reticulomyxa filosa]